MCALLLRTPVLTLWSFGKDTVALLLDSLFLESHQVLGLGESKEPNATSLHASSHGPVQTAAIGHSCTFAIQK